MTARELVSEHGSAQVEAALWSAVHALSERAVTLETLARDSQKSGNPQSAATYEQRKFMLDLIQPR